MIFSVLKFDLISQAIIQQNHIFYPDLIERHIQRTLDSMMFQYSKQRTKDIFSWHTFAVNLS